MASCQQKAKQNYMQRLKYIRMVIELENSNGVDNYTTLLKKAMVVKNYPTLCEILGEKPSTGTSKMAQIKRWRRYFDWEQKGQKYVILDVYEEPLPKELSDNATYAKFFELILMGALKQCNEGIYHFYQNQLFETFGMVNSDYKNLRKEEYIESAFGVNGREYPEVTIFGARVFSRLTYKRMSDITQSALRGLMNSGLIIFEKGYAIKREIGTENGKSIYEYETATEDEKKAILNAEQLAMDELGITSKWFGYTSKYKTEFVAAINRYLNQYDCTMLGALQRYTIIYNRPPETHIERVERKIKKELRAAGYEYSDDQDSRNQLVRQCKQVLNDMIVCSLDQYSRLKAENAKRKLEDGRDEWGPNAQEATLECRYLISQQFRFEFDTLIDRFIKY